MTKTLRIIVPAAVMALAACAPPDDLVLENSAAEANAAPIIIANPFHDQLEAATPVNRHLAMMRAIRSHRQRCVRVDNAAYQEDYRNMRMWVAHCPNEQKNFAVFIAPNGDAQVRDCETAGELGLPRCQGLPPAPPEQNMFREGASDAAFRNRITPREEAR